MAFDPRDEQIIHLTGLVSRLTEENDKLRQELAKSQAGAQTSASGATVNLTTPASQFSPLADVLGFPKEGR